MPILRSEQARRHLPSPLCTPLTSQGLPSLSSIVLMAADWQLFTALGIRPSPTMQTCGQLLCHARYPDFLNPDLKTPLARLLRRHLVVICPVRHYCVHSDESVTQRLRVTVSRSATALTNSTLAFSLGRHVNMHFLSNFSASVAFDHHARIPAAERNPLRHIFMVKSAPSLERRSRKPT
jgi:hypothetical protein